MQILKKHLDAVAYVMVVGSKKPFLSCMLTLKTHVSPDKTFPLFIVDILLDFCSSVRCSDPDDSF
jgi:hypothetical protein